MTQEPDIEAIAGRLTEAQRKELGREYPMRVRNADWRVFPALKRRLCLLVYHDTKGLSLSLTPLGEQVRSHLLKGQRP